MVVEEPVVDEISQSIDYLPNSPVSNSTQPVTEELSIANVTEFWMNENSTANVTESWANKNSTANETESLENDKSTVNEFTFDYDDFLSYIGCYPKI